MEYQLKLLSPVGSDPITYKWQDRMDCTTELIETIRWVCEDLPELKQVLGKELTLANTSKSLERVKILACKYNKHVKRFLELDKETTAKLIQPKASRELLRHILQQVYSRAVPDPEKLNQYTPFSPEVYGETSYDLICQVIDHVSFTESDTFIDLGSGIGQIVLQIAASTPCKFAWGIERAEWPSRYAEDVDRHFKRLMKWWGKRHGEYKLIKGDFLDFIHSEKLKSSTIILVNNFAFGPALDNQLIERFNEALEGTRIISSKAFCPLNFRITPRTLSNVGCIMHVSELPRIKGSVSWTGNAVTYYLHLIDRRKLHSYFEKQKNKENKRSSDKKECHVSKESSKPTDETEPATNLMFSPDVLPTPPLPDDELCGALNVHLEGIRNQMMTQISRFGDVEYQQSINNAIHHQEKLRDRRELEARLLEKEVAQLTIECVVLLRRRMAEVGVNFDSESDFSRTVIQICSRIKELEEQNRQLQDEILNLNRETTEIQEFCRQKSEQPLNEEELMGNQTHLILHEVNQQGDACTKLKRNFEMRVCSVKAAEHSELGVQVPCATEFDASCEIHLKDMISSVLEEKTFAANVQARVVPIDRANVQYTEQQSVRTLKLSCFLPEEQIFYPQTRASSNLVSKRCEASRHDQ